MGSGASQSFLALQKEKGVSAGVKGRRWRRRALEKNKGPLFSVELEHKFKTTVN